MTAPAAPTAPSPWGRRARSLAIVAAAVLTLGWGATRWLVARAEARFPRVGQRVDADGIAMHVVDRGTGVPVVCLHGAYGGCQDFLATIAVPLVASGHRVLAFDRPGHGYSEVAATHDPATQARHVAAALRALDVQRPVVVGFSLGGAVALALALELGDDIAGLVLVAPASHPWPGGPGATAHLLGTPVLGPLSAHTWMPPLGHLLADGAAARAFGEQPVDPRFAAHSPVPLALRPDALLHNGADLLALRPALVEQAPRYARLTVPTTVLADPDDEVVWTDVHAEGLAREMAHVELQRTPGGGHQLLYTRTAEVVAAVRARAAATGLAPAAVGGDDSKR